uniref:Uncharacterized protein n=2 Tax=Amorphochlora amoebiformis TaxID=1561963 RepID=A0A7S0GR57_9EUKA|mmetsp:Transcript_12325/g.19548  ORF Transcript_12325/g.19548 Transcript_12325/m.19548 type:complete len:171 (+) Transcript_12325:133-645(+)
MISGGDNKKGSNSIQCLTESGFKSLYDITKTLLDQCIKQKDYKKGLAVMEVSNVFYFQIKDSRKRKFLGDVLQKHKFWKNLSFWRAALKSAVVRKSFKRRNNDDFFNFIQGWLVENLHKMVMFKINMKKVQQFVNEVTDRHNLPVRRKNEIQGFVDRMEEMAKAMQALSM